MYTLTFLVVAQFSIVVHPWKCRELTSHVFSTMKENKKTKKKKKPLFFWVCIDHFCWVILRPPPPPHPFSHFKKCIFFFLFYKPFNSSSTTTTTSIQAMCILKLQRLSPYSSSILFSLFRVVNHCHFPVPSSTITTCRLRGGLSVSFPFLYDAVCY